MLYKFDGGNDRKVQRRPSPDDPDVSGLLHFLGATAHIVTVIARVRLPPQARSADVPRDRFTMSGGSENDFPSRFQEAPSAEWQRRARGRFCTIRIGREWFGDARPYGA